VTQSLSYCWHQGHLWLDGSNGTLCFEDITQRPVNSSASAGTGTISASMDGSIVALQVEAGQQVNQGDTLMVLDAMKMEHPLKADIDGVVESINVAAGSQVKGRQLLATLKPRSDD